MSVPSPTSRDATRQRLGAAPRPEASSHQEAEGRFSIDGRLYTRQDPDLEPALALAYANRNRPRCLCTPGGVEMYVSRVAGHYVVKRMPLTASAHAEHCAARHGVVVVRAEHDYRDPAIQQDEADITRIAINVPLSTQAGTRLFGEGAPNSDVAQHLGPRQHSVTLPELVHHLWHEAGLDRWHPRFEGRRNWAVVRYYLQRAMANIYVGRSPLLGRMFIPEPFRPERRMAIERRLQQDWWCSPEQNQRLHGAAGNDGKRTRLLLLAEVKEIAPPAAERGWRRMTLRQLPDIVFELAERECRSMVHAHADLLRSWVRGETVHLLLVAVLDPEQAGLPRLQSPALIGATAQWLLVQTADERDRRGTWGLGASSSALRDR